MYIPLELDHFKPMLSPFKAAKSVNRANQDCEVKEEVPIDFSLCEYED